MFEMGLTIILITVNLFIMLNTSALKKNQSPRSVHLAGASRDACVTFLVISSLSCVKA